MEIIRNQSTVSVPLGLFGMMEKSYSVPYSEGRKRELREDLLRKRKGLVSVMKSDDFKRVEPVGNRD